MKQKNYFHIYAPNVSKETTELTNQTLQNNGWQLVPVEKSTQGRFKVVHSKSPTEPLLLTKLYRYNGNLVQDPLSIQLTESLHQEFLSGDEKSLTSLFKYGDSDLAKNLIKNFDLSIRYLTLPIIMDKINSKNLKVYSSLIKDRDKFYIFIEKLMSHPNWDSRHEEIKEFLIENKHEKTI